MASNNLVQDVLGILDATPVIDVHTHLVGGRMGADGLHDILLYHMAVSDLHAAGCPDGARLTQYPGRPDDEEAERRIRAALPYLQYVPNTSTSWGVRIALSDLYGFDGQVDQSNWQALDAAVRERSADKSWPVEVMKRANIRRFGTEIARREDGSDDRLLTYALEWGFFTRCQWGEYDTALYELEKCWGHKPGPPSPIGGTRPSTERTISSLDDVHEAIEWYVSQIPQDVVKAQATHISTDIDFTPVNDEQMRSALARRSTAGAAERDIYASYVNEAFLSLLEQKAPGVLFQFSLAAEPLPFETASRISQRTIAQLGEMIARHPKLQFQCYLSSRHADQSLCTLCRELPNFSLAAYWWHNFFPGAIRQVVEERLDMLPLNRQVGFFSDAYCVEWAYAKLQLVKRQMAVVLADKVSSGQYTLDMVEQIARAILFDTPRTLNGIEPAQL